MKRENYKQGVNADEEGESKKRKREEKRGKERKNGVKVESAKDKVRVLKRVIEGEG